MIIVGFSGPIGSGKTTAASMLVRELGNMGFDARRHSFAHLLKIITNIVGDTEISEGEKLRTVLPLFLTQPVLQDPGYETRVVAAVHQMIDYGHQFPNDGQKKNRRLMQLVGTECGRNMISENIWIDLVRNDINRSQSDRRMAFVFDDVRFDNEAAILKYHIHIRIVNHEKYMDRVSSFDKGYVHMNHASEQSLTRTPNAYLDNEFTQKDISFLADTVITSSNIFMV